MNKIIHKITAFSTRLSFNIQHDYDLDYLPRDGKT